MNSYDFRFFVRFTIGAIGGLAAMTICMGKWVALSQEGLASALLLLEVFAAPLYFFTYYRLRPFREFRKGLRVAVPDWDWGRDIATAVISSALSAGLWLTAVTKLEGADILPAPGGIASWSLFSVMFVATWLLLWVVCKALGLFPPPLKPGWGG